MSNKCGKHTELSANDHVRVTQCACGAVHLMLLKNGVTLRLTEESLRHTTRGMLLAVDRVDDVEHARNN